LKFYFKSRIFIIHWYTSKSKKYYTELPSCYRG